jgi:hypothetical protein
MSDSQDTTDDMSLYPHIIINNSAPKKIAR